MDYFKRVAALTPTKFWVNNMSREEAHLGISVEASGCTQNTLPQFNQAFQEGGLSVEAFEHCVLVMHSGIVQCSWLHHYDNNKKGAADETRGTDTPGCC